MPLPFEYAMLDAFPFLQDESWVLIDGREQDEWDAGHFPRASLMPLSERNPSSLVSFDKHQKIDK